MIKNCGSVWNFCGVVVCKAFGEIGQANVTSELCSINLNFATRLWPVVFGTQSNPEDWARAKG
jgi:hypothetical protein